MDLYLKTMVGWMVNNIKTMVGWMVGDLMVMVGWMVLLFEAEGGLRFAPPPSLDPPSMFAPSGQTNSTPDHELATKKLFYLTRLCRG